MSIAAALLSYHTIAQVDGLLAGKLGVTEAASALQIAVRFPDDGGADEVVAAIGEQILAPTDVSLSNWTVRPSSGCSVVLATHTAGAVSVDGDTLTLAVNPAESSSSPAATGSARVVCMSEADNVYDPLYGSFVGDQGAWSTAKMYFTVPPNGVAKLHFGAHFQAPGLPNQTAGTVDVYGLQILDATLETGNAVEAEKDTAASALLLKHKFLSPSSVAEPVRASESASKSVTETDSPSKALALICMLYRSSVPADCCTSPEIEPPKAPKCSFAIPPGGTEKSRRAVLQTPCEGVPRKVPVTPT